jgi:hypothetical protein
MDVHIDIKNLRFTVQFWHVNSTFFAFFETVKFNRNSALNIKYVSFLCTTFFCVFQSCRFFSYARDTLSNAYRSLYEVFVIVSV